MTLPKPNPTAAIGNMGGMPDVADNTATPCRTAAAPLVVPASSGPTTTRSDGARIVGDMGGMPKVTENRSVAAPGPIEKVADSASQLPAPGRQI